MKAIRLSLIAVSAAVACLAAHAQQRPAAPQTFGPASFETFDRDGSGAISEAEFDAVRGARRGAAAQAGRPMRRAADSLSFKEIDRDGDGQLTRQEFDGAHAAQPARPGSRPGAGAGMGPSSGGRGAGMGPGGGGRGAGMGPGGGGRGVGMGPGAGVNRPSFKDYDLNQDGAITEPEFHAARSGRIQDRLQEGRQMRNLRDAAETFGEMDTNPDGKVTPAEFAAHQTARARGPAR